MRLLRKPDRASGQCDARRFRPKGGALGLEGDFSTEHYWWLAFDWRNIYPACVYCNKVKGSKFPVVGQRCRPKTPYEGLGGESRLLVDPALDEPADHLRFTGDGHVRAASQIGEATIATLELNRTELVTARQVVARKTNSLVGSSAVRAALRQWPHDWQAPLVVASKTEGSNSALTALAALVARAQPFAAVARAIVLEVIAQKSSKSAAPPSKGSPAMAAPAAEPAHVPDQPKLKPIKQGKSPLRSQTITRIEMKNFRGIADLDLGIDFSTGLGAPWTVLLGENGAGKSSILQALALTLLNSDSGRARRAPQTGVAQGHIDGFVRVWFHATTAARTAFRRGAHRFLRKGPNYNGTLLGYGATRLLPRQRMKQDD